MEDITDEESTLDCKRVLIRDDSDRSQRSSNATDSSKSRSHQSCTPFCGLFLSVVRNLNCKGKKKKTDQADLSCTPQNGLVIRMISDDAKEEEEAGVEVSESSRLKVDDVIDRSGLGGMDETAAGSSIFIPRVSSFSGDQEAEERLLSRVSGRLPAASGPARFLTLHRRRKRRPPTRALLFNSALLDDLYNGQTQCVLSRVALWDFNTFALDSVCGGRPVAVLCVFLFHEYNLLNEFSLDSVTVWKCFSLIEEGYHASNPYHNAVHAADVTQAMYCYLQENAIAQYLTPFEKFAAIIASVCHDLDHPGVNQPFLIATDNHLAALYNNASVLENHHWRCAMGCLWESGILNNWSAENVTRLQDEIRSLILATDITRQSEFLSKFKKYQETETLDMTLPECRHFSLQIALKCADISNPCRPWEVSRQWSHRICDEFYRQGDYERQLRLPVTSMCDRYVNSVAKIQSGFMKFVVSPLFDSWDNWLHTKLSATMQTYLRENLLHWENFLVEERKCLEEENSLPPNRSTSNATSSVGSQVSVVGAMESAVSHCVPLGRRYSLPLTVTSLLPRTIIRRESLCEGGKATLILETVQIGEMSVASVVTSSSSPVTEERDPLEDQVQPIDVTDDALYPESTIAAMGDVGLPRKTKIGRRQSLPPLWGGSFVPSKVLRPLEPLPATPLQEETPSSESDEEEESPAVTLAKLRGCDVSEGGDPTTSSATNNESSGGSDEAGVSDRMTDACATKSVLSTSAKTRRCSLDNGKRDSENENIACKWPRLNADSKGHKRPLEPSIQKNQRDKENVAPSERHILKTRLWRSLNHDEGLCPDNRLKAAMYKNLNQNYTRGRRGSAPILKMESLRGSCRGIVDVNPDCLTRRRGSAPSHQMHLHLGCDAMRSHADEKLTSVPVWWKQNLLVDGGDRNGNVTSRLTRRRGSVPTEYDVPLLDNATPQVVNQNLFCEPSNQCSRLNRNGYGGGSGGDAIGHSLYEGNLNQVEGRRGSSGFELLSGLWRYHLGGGPNSNSLCSDDSVGLSSSGAGTPVTPGAIGPLAGYQVPSSLLPTSPYYRRGSLPSDVYTSVEARKWSNEAAS